MHWSHVRQYLRAANAAAPLVPITSFPIVWLILQIFELSPPIPIFRPFLEKMTNAIAIFTLATLLSAATASFGRNLGDSFQSNFSNSMIVRLTVDKVEKHLQNVLASGTQKFDLNERSVKCCLKDTSSYINFPLGSEWNWEGKIEVYLEGTPTIKNDAIPDSAREFDALTSDDFDVYERSSLALVDSEVQRLMETQDMVFPHGLAWIKVPLGRSGKFAVQWTGVPKTFEYPDGQAMINFPESHEFVHYDH